MICTPKDIQITQLDPNRYQGPNHEFNLYFGDLSQVQGKKMVQVESV